MKKILCFSLLTLGIIVTILSTFGNINVNAASSIEDYNTYGLGKTVNVAKDDYLDQGDINKANYIFDEKWLNTRFITTDIIDDSNQYSNNLVSSGTSVEQMTQAYQNNFKFGVGADVDIFKIFTGSIKSKFNISTALNIENYKYQFYYNYYGFHSRYYASLYGASDTTLYANNLDQTYEGYLNLLFRGAITPQIFFEKYGTHVITSGVYGGRIDFNYYAFNNQKMINEELKLAAENELTTQLTKKIQGTAEYSFEFGTTIGFNNMSTTEDYNLESRGGEYGTGIASFTNFSAQLEEWLENLDNKNSTLIDIREDGLIPLWDLLPSYHLDKKQWFKEECLKYINSYNNDFDEYYFAPNIGDTYNDGVFYEIRKGEVCISSDDPSYNSYDSIDLNFATKYGYDLLVAEGYSSMKIEVQMYLKEQKRGYQEIFLYNNYEDNTNYQVAYKRYELGDNAKIQEYTLETFVFDNISIDDFENGMLYIKYGSDGVGSNVWYCKDIKIKVTYYK